MPPDDETLPEESSGKEALPSGQEEEATSGADGEEQGEPEGEEEAKPQPPPMPTFKLSTFILVFLFFLGMWMLISNSARMQVAGALGDLLYPVFGFGGSYPLLTMFLVGLVQMSISAVAYNYTTDWVETAKLQHHSKAIRPLQMAAMRSGKKHHMESLKPHMNDINTRQSKMMIGQLKGMAVTWFLLIAMYTWIGIFLSMKTTVPTQEMFGLTVDLTKSVAVFPLWFLVFSLYTVPFNLLLRRLLKHKALSDRLETLGGGVAGAST